MNDHKLFEITQHGVMVRTPDFEEELSKFAWKEINSILELRDFL